MIFANPHWSKGGVGVNFYLHCFFLGIEQMITICTEDSYSPTPTNHEDGVELN